LKMEGSKELICIKNRLQILFIKTWVTKRFLFLSCSCATKLQVKKIFAVKQLFKE